MARSRAQQERQQQQQRFSSSSQPALASLFLSALGGELACSAERKEAARAERKKAKESKHSLFSPLIRPLFFSFNPDPPTAASASTMASSGDDLPLLIKPASLQTPTKALVPGTLSIARMRGSWQPRDATSASPLHFAYKTLTGALQRAKGKPMLRLPLPTGPRVIVFESVEDTDQVVDLLTPLIAREQQGGGDGAAGPSSSSAAAASTQQPAKADAWAHAKRKLLEEDK